MNDETKNIETNVPVPERLSDLIRMALADLNNIEVNPNYIVDMLEWHRKDDDSPICRVCLAGSVMANTLDAPLEEDLAPFDFGKDWEVALHILDDLRHSFISTPTFRSLFVGEEVLERIKYDIASVGVPRYDKEPLLFKARLSEIASILEGAGL